MSNCVCILPCSRQRYVLGDHAMHEMARSSVFLSGLGGLGVEIGTVCGEAVIVSRSRLFGIRLFRGCRKRSLRETEAVM